MENSPRSESTQQDSQNLAPIEHWLHAAADRGASDLHVVAGHPPTLRWNGQLVELDYPELSGPEVIADLESICAPQQIELLHRTKNVDFALVLPHKGNPRRYRANLFMVGGKQLGGCFRVIPSTIPSFEWTTFPYELADRIAHFRNGLALITGVTGAGKTTTLAQIINLLNEEGGYRIITIEDPVEYEFPRVENSIVSQREVGQDVQSFADGLKYGLRQDPDVILVGEIRDQETAQIALSAAETGHLVLATLHTRDAKGAISRFTDLFPPSVQHEARAQLSRALRAVVSQHLLPSVDEGKRVLALEILINNNPIASAIRLGKLESIDVGIVTGRNEGMISLDESLRRLMRDGMITRDIAERYATDMSVLNRG